MLGNKILLIEIDPLVEEGIKVVIEEIITRNNYRPNYRNRSRGRWNNHRSGDRSGNYPHYNRQGNTRPHHRQNTQWTFRNRSQSRSRMKTMVMIILEVEVEIEIKGDEKNPGLDLIQG